MKKRILCVAMALTMALSLAACGSSKKKVDAGNEVKVTVDEVSEKLSSAIKDVKSLSVDVNAALDLNIEAGGESFSAKCDIDGNAKGSIENPSGHIKLDASYSVDTNGEKQSDDAKLEAYLEQDGDNIVAYSTEDGKEWSKNVETLEEFKSSFTDMFTEMIGDSSDDESTSENPELLPTISDKTVSEEGKECYEIKCTVDKSALSNVLGSTEYASYLGMFQNLNVAVIGYVDVKTNLPVKFVLTADMAANDSASGLKIELKKCELTLVADYDNVDKIDVPNDIKDKATEE